MLNLTLFAVRTLLNLTRGDLGVGGGNVELNIGSGRRVAARNTLFRENTLFLLYAGTPGNRGLFLLNRVIE